MNPHKSKTGCMVPHCEESDCNYQRKNICALRRYFLQDQKNKRRYLSQHRNLLLPGSISILKKEIYFWRKYDLKKKKAQ